MNKKYKSLGRFAFFLVVIVLVLMYFNSNGGRRGRAGTNDEFSSLLDDFNLRENDDDYDDYDDYDDRSWDTYNAMDDGTLLELNKHVH